MKRKVVQLGPSTLVVSMPTKWVKEEGIKAGQEVDVVENGNTVVITSKISRKGDTEVDLSRLRTLLRRLVVAKYIAGYDEITVKFDDIKAAKIVQKRAKDLIGMEAVSQTEKTLVLREIADTTQQSFEPMLRRVFLLLISMAEESEKLIKKGETELDFISDMEENINNFTDYCMRILYKTGHEKQGKVPSLYSLVQYIELLGDEYKWFLTYITENKIRLKPKQIELYSEMNRLLRMVYELYYSYSYEKSQDVALLRDRVVNKLARQKNTTSAKTVILLSYLDKAIDYMMHCMGEMHIIYA